MATATGNLQLARRSVALFTGGWYIGDTGQHMAGTPSTTMPRAAQTSSVQDWRRLRAVLLRQEHQLDAQLLQAAQGDDATDELVRQRGQLRALRELCDALGSQAMEAPRQPTMQATLPPSHPGTAEALETEGSRASCALDARTTPSWWSMTTRPRCTPPPGS